MFLPTTSALTHVFCCLQTSMSTSLHKTFLISRKEKWDGYLRCQLDTKQVLLHNTNQPHGTPRKREQQFFFSPATQRVTATAYMSSCILIPSRLSETIINAGCGKLQSIVCPLQEIHLLRTPFFAKCKLKLKVYCCSFRDLCCFCRWLPAPSNSVKPLATAPNIPLCTSKCAKSTSYKHRALVNVPLVWRKNQEQCGLIGPAGSSQWAAAKRGARGKTDVTAKCVTLSASSKGTWFPTDLCFKAGVQRGVKFLLCKSLSPVDS